MEGIGTHLPPVGRSVGTRLLPLGEIVAICQRQSFTGTLVFSAGSSQGTLLFRGGKPVCAEYGGLSGASALRKIRAGKQMVTGTFFPCFVSEVDAVLPSNAPWKTEAAVANRQASTTVRPVRVRGRTPTARVRTVRTVEKTETVQRPDQRAPISSTDKKKQILNPAAVEELRHLEEDFQKDASMLLKEMNMGHLIAGKKNKSI